MSDTPTQAAPPPAKPRKRRGVRWLFAAGLCVLMLAGAMIGGAFWAAGTTSGSTWLVARLALLGIQVDVTELEGSLIGDLKARRVVVTAGRTRVVVERAAWRNLSLSFTSDPGTWVRIHASSLVAERVVITVAPGSGGPFKLPRDLLLPLELQVDDVQAGELHVPGLPDHPFREVRTAVHLGQDHGRQHRFETVSGRLDPLFITGHARIAATGPMAMDVEAQAVQSPKGLAALPTLPPWAKSLRTDWHAQAESKGPLAKFNMKGQLRAQGQSLDATAQVEPEARWALPLLAARTQGLDLSALLQQAPLTSLNGSVSITPENTPGAQTLAFVADIDNAKPGRWDAQHLPVRSLGLTARWRTDHADEFTLPRFELALADERRGAGAVQGLANWKAGEFAIEGKLSAVQPSALDARLPAMTLGGPVTLSGKWLPQGPDGRPVPPRFTALADLSGKLADLPQAVNLKLDATGSEARVELRELRASAGGARAELHGTGERAGDGWQVDARAALVDFDPRLWFPAGPGGGWQGTHHFNLQGEATLRLADSLRLSGTHDKRGLMERLSGLHGNAKVRLDNSVVAGVPLTGDVNWQHATGTPIMQAGAALDAGGNRVVLTGQWATEARGQNDRWDLEARAPALARLAPLLRMLVPAGQAAQLLESLKGSLTAETHATGRWPDMSTEGRATLNNVQTGAWSVGQGQARWQMGANLDAPLELQLDVSDAEWAQRKIGSTKLQLKGSGREHQFSLGSELKVAPPVWVESLQGVRTAAATAAASSPASPASAAGSNGAPRTAPLRTLLSVSGKGSLAGNLLAHQGAHDQGSAWSWSGMLEQLELRNPQPGTLPLLLTRDISIELQSGPPLRTTISAGRADIVGTRLTWNRIEWQAGQGPHAQQLDLQAELEPVQVAPLLRRIQPTFGWGGDLVIGGRVIVKQTDAFSADIVLERVRGDLTVTEESGTQALGLTDLRVGLDAKDGVWNFTAGLAGQQLGVLGGAMVVRTSPQRAWPAADAQLQGVLEAQVANLGTWGAWVPAGWRLDGQLNISATLGGRFDAPEYTGKMLGKGIGVRNMVEGINVTDGQVDIALEGDTARINTFSARGGTGTVRVEGEAKLEENWRARLKLVADKFQLLGKVDLRVIASGAAEIVIDAESVKSEGRFKVDEGLIDFTRLSSPSLSDDVVVTGRSSDPRDAAPTLPASGNRISLDLLVNLGDNLRMRGLGIDTKLHGELRVSRPGGKWALAGAINTAGGSFKGYNQQLVIDKGVITFNGPPSDMHLDIEATRPNLDSVRVGLKVTGPLSSLRVRIFSEPDMTMNEKMAWLVLGRASDGLGKSDTALVQRAAFALLAGDSDGGPGAITKAFGIDELGMRQTDGDTRETVVSVGKRLSDRIYVAYEQNLATSAGSFQVTYRIAQRFVMRLQSGLDRSIDLIGTWRWE